MSFNLNYKNWDYSWVILLLMFLAAALSSCDFDSRVRETTMTTEDSDMITYFKDDRVGLCYAAIGSQGHSYSPILSITCVPCDSVKHLLK